MNVMSVIFENVFKMNTNEDRIPECLRNVMNKYIPTKRERKKTLNTPLKVGDGYQTSIAELSEWGALLASLGELEGWIDQKDECIDIVPELEEDLKARSKQSKLQEDELNLLSILELEATFMKESRRSRSLPWGTIRLLQATGLGEAEIYQFLSSAKVSAWNEDISKDIFDALRDYQGRFIAYWHIHRFAYQHGVRDFQLYVYHWDFMPTVSCALVAMKYDHPVFKRLSG